MKKETAKTIIWVSTSTFVEGLILVAVFPNFINVVSAAVISISLVTALVVAFDNFYDDPSDPKNW